MKELLNVGSMLSPNNTELSAQDRGDRARDARQWTEAVKHYIAHLAANPDDFGILVQLGNCSKESGDFEVARQSYERAISINDHDADVRVQLGHLLKITGRLQEAIDSYSCAMAIDPAHRDAVHERDAILSALKSNNEIGVNLADIGMPAFSNLQDLLAYLRKYPFRSNIFKEYFVEFVPS